MHAINTVSAPNLYVSLCLPSLPSKPLQASSTSNQDHSSVTQLTHPSSITCTLTPSLRAVCSGHVTNIACSTTMNAAFLTSYAYRAVTITDSFPISPITSTSTSPSTTLTVTSPPKTTMGPTGINSAILTSYAETMAGGIGTTNSAEGGLGGPGVTSMTKSAQAPRVTGVLGMDIGIVAAVAVAVAVGWEAYDVGY